MIVAPSRWRQAFGLTVLFGSGGLAFAALERQFYASALVCLIAALTTATIALMRRPPPLPGREAEARRHLAAEVDRYRLQALLDQTSQPILLQIEDGPVQAVNEPARRLFATSGPLARADRLRLMGGQVTLSGLADQILWEGARFRLHKSRLEEAGQTSHLVILTDISADIRAAEAAALRDVLKVLNHELMNALTPVASMSRSALDILTTDGPSGVPDAVGALQRVVARTEGLIGFTRSYRTLSRLPAPDLRPADADPWWQGLVAAFRAQWSGVLLEVEPSRLDVALLMDTEQMRLCLGNLLNNAAEAARHAPTPHVRLRALRDAGEIRIFVEDNGPGISPDRMDAVFLPFYTTRPQGSGVGLTLARQIVKGHGGDLTLLTPGKRPADALSGACFLVSLPGGLR